MGGPAQPVHDVRPALSGSCADVQQERVVWQRARAQLLEHGCNTRRVEGATVRHTRELARRGAAEGLTLVHSRHAPCRLATIPNGGTVNVGYLRTVIGARWNQVTPCARACPTGCRGQEAEVHRSALLASRCASSLCTGAPSSGCNAATPLFIPLWCPPTVTPRVQVDVVLQCGKTRCLKTSAKRAPREPARAQQRAQQRAGTG